MRIFNFVVIALFFSNLSAFADQCQWNDRSVAQRARAYLAYHPGPIYKYCEPCNDAGMQRIAYGQNKEDTLDRRAVNFRWVSRDAITPGALGWQLTFNEGFEGVERSVDLAYIFIRSEQGFVNVGGLIACTAERTIGNRGQDVIQRGMPTGVSYFITPERAPAITDDVTDTDFLRAYEARYPNDPRG